LGNGVLLCFPQILTLSSLSLCSSATKLVAVLAKEFTRLAITANIAILGSHLYDMLMLIMQTDAHGS